MIILKLYFTRYLSRSICCFTDANEFVLLSWILLRCAAET